MDIKNFIAGMQIAGTRIVECTISNNFVSFGRDPDDLDISVDYKITSIQEQEEAKLGIMQVHVAISYRDDDGNSFSMDVTNEGGFHVPLETNNEEFGKMLAINGTACLYSLARAFVSTVTSLSFACGNILLPLINTVRVCESAENEQDN